MLIIGADHAGFELKYKVIEYLKENNIEFIDVTDYEIDNNDDYPDIAKNICLKLKNQDKAIAICGSGIGISIACNKIKRIRAANCFDKNSITMAIKDNNINVLCLGGRTKLKDDNKNLKEIIDIFLNEKFLNGRHQRRIDKITALENIKSEEL